MATVYSGLDKDLAKMVKTDVHDQAFELAQVAKTDLLSHRETGAADIEVDYTPTDAVISLVDEAAMSIEYGRAGYVNNHGHYVGPAEGLHILGKLL